MLFLIAARDRVNANTDFKNNCKRSLEYGSTNTSFRPSLTLKYSIDLFVCLCVCGGGGVARSRCRMILAKKAMKTKKKKLNLGEKYEY